MIRFVCIAFGKMKRASSAGTSAWRRLAVELEVVVDRALEATGQVVGQVAVGDAVGDRVVVALLEADVALRLLVEGRPARCRRAGARASGSRH